MKINKYKTMGVDCWFLDADIETLVRIAHEKDWQLYDVTIQNDGLLFYTPVWIRHEIMRTYERITLIKTTGMLGFLFRQFKKPYRIVCLLFCLGIWYGLSHTVFSIQIQGDKVETKQLIEQTLVDMGYRIPLYKKDMQVLKGELKKRLENDISWMEVSEEGSTYKIQFTTKEFATLEELNRNELVAQKDGVIAKFEVLHGNKVVSLNQFVHKGDILVSNLLVDSKNESKDVYVKGKVYAYTWKDVRVEIPKNDLPKPFQFFHLLMEARREVSENLNREETIHKENILQFQDNTGTISMDVHYTLYEDITTP